MILKKQNGLPQGGPFFIPLLTGKVLFAIILLSFTIRGDKNEKVFCHIFDFRDGFFPGILSDGTVRTVSGRVGASGNGAGRIYPADGGRFQGDALGGFLDEPGGIGRSAHDLFIKRTDFSVYKHFDEL